jgi:predicted Zn finger-like uncharacterized protein
MKIVCENCGAKYSIADEKIKGKVFKIRCKKCSESIVIRGDVQQEEPAPEAAAFAPPPMPESAYGGEEEEGDAPTRVFDYSGYQGGGGQADEAVWHIVVDGEQQGPYTAGQLAEYVTAGNLDFETFVWKEGFDDWKPIREVQDIAGKVKGAPAPAAAPVAAAGGGLFGAAAGGGGGLFDQPAGGGGGLFDQPAGGGGGGGLFDQPAGGGGGGLFDQPAGGGGGLFDAPAGGGGGGLFDAPEAPADSGGLFASPGAQQRPSGAGLFDGGDAGGQDLFSGGDGGGIFASTGPAAAAPSPRVSAQQAMMTGARNENSVLFSLSNLQALASGGASGGGGGGGGGAFGALGAKPAKKGDEASGLIDIRSLAGSVPLERDAAGAPDDLLSIGGAGFAPALGAPVLTAHREGMGIGAKIGIIAGAVALAAAAVVLVIYLMHEDEPPKETGPDPQLALLLAEIEKLKASGGSAEDVKAAERKLADEQARKTEAETVAAAGGDAQKDGDDDDKKAGKAGGGSKTSGGGAKTTGGGGAKASGGDDKPAAGGGDTKTAAAGGGGTSKPKGAVSELDDLLGGGGGAAKPAPKKQEAPAPAAGGGGGGLPEKLTKSQVQSGMQSVAGAVKACDTSGAGGTVTVQVTIAPSGKVTEANPTGASAGTPVGLCAARAVRRAKFPETQSSLNVTYPFKL